MMDKKVTDMVFASISRKEQAMRKKASRYIKKQAKKQGIYDNTIISVTVDGKVVQQDIMSMEDPISVLKKFGVVE